MTPAQLTHTLNKMVELLEKIEAYTRPQQPATEMLIIDLTLSIRAANILSLYFFQRGKDKDSLPITALAKIRERDLRKIKGCGYKTILEIKEVMREHQLNMLP